MSQINTGGLPYQAINNGGHPYEGIDSGGLPYSCMGEPTTFQAIESGDDFYVARAPQGIKTSDGYRAIKTSNGYEAIEGATTSTTRRPKSSPESSQP